VVVIGFLRGSVADDNLPVSKDPTNNEYQPQSILFCGTLRRTDLIIVEIAEFILQT
jgi:hypothetical protein